MCYLSVFSVAFGFFLFALLFLVGRPTHSRLIHLLSHRGFISVDSFPCLHPKRVAPSPGGCSPTPAVETCLLADPGWTPESIAPPVPVERPLTSLLQMLSIPGRLWSLIALDFIPAPRCNTTFLTPTAFDMGHLWWSTLCARVTLSDHRPQFWEDFAMFLPHLGQPGPGNTPARRAGTIWHHLPWLPASTVPQEVEIGVP